MRPSFSSWMLLYFYLASSDAAVTTHEYLLREILLSNHSKDVFPVKTTTQTLDIFLDMKLIAIEGLDDRTQVISILMQLTRRWQNDLLSWDKDQHGGIEYLTLSASELWLPDIQTQDEDFTCASDCQSRQKVVIHESGECDWIVTQFRVRHHCELNLRYFPFDTQSCEVNFHPRDDYGGRLRIRAGKLVESASFSANHIWRVLSHAWNNQTEIEEEEKHYQVVFRVDIKRKPTHYMYTLFIPCLVVASMTVLGILLPVESGERMSMIMTSLLAMVVLMQFSSDSLPPSSDEAPHIIDYYVSTLILIMVSMVMSCVVINFYHSGETGSKPPRWLKSFTVNVLAKASCANPPPLKEKGGRASGSYPDHVLMAMDNKIDPTDHHPQNNHKNAQKDNPNTNNMRNSASRNSALAWMYAREEEEEWDVDEWKYVASVIDRTQLIIIGIVFLLYSVIFITLMAMQKE